MAYVGLPSERGVVAETVGTALHAAAGAARGMLSLLHGNLPAEVPPSASDHYPGREVWAELAKAHTAAQAGVEVHEVEVPHVAVA